MNEYITPPTITTISPVAGAFRTSFNEHTGDLFVCTETAHAPSDVKNILQKIHYYAPDSIDDSVKIELPEDFSRAHFCCSKYFFYYSVNSEVYQYSNSTLELRNNFRIPITENYNSIDSIYFNELRNELYLLCSNEITHNGGAVIVDPSSTFYISEIDLTYNGCNNTYYKHQLYPKLKKVYFANGNGSCIAIVDVSSDSKVDIFPVDDNHYCNTLSINTKTGILLAAILPFPTEGREVSTILYIDTANNTIIDRMYLNDLTIQINFLEKEELLITHNLTDMRIYNNDKECIGVIDNLDPEKYLLSDVAFDELNNVFYQNYVNKTDFKSSMLRILDFPASILKQ